jgi:transcription elongation GreA/GreB family factor
MSRAFVKETAESAAPPERMVEDSPNPVTPEGMAQIDAHIAGIEEAMKSEANVLLRETLARDLRYWSIRKSSAQLVQPAGDGTVAFGSAVTITRKGRTQRIRIVGVDEADAGKSLISAHAPLARTVMGAHVGDLIEADEPPGRDHCPVRRRGLKRGKNSNRHKPLFRNYGGVRRAPRKGVEMVLMDHFERRTRRAW